MPNAEAVKPAAQGARYGQVFAVGPFRALFGGTVLTIVATSLQMLGLSVLVYLATGSAWLSAVAYGRTSADDRHTIARIWALTCANADLVC